MNLTELNWTELELSHQFFFQFQQTEAHLAEFYFVFLNLLLKLPELIVVERLLLLELDLAELAMTVQDLIELDPAERDQVEQHQAELDLAELDLAELDLIQLEFVVLDQLYPELEVCYTHTQFYNLEPLLI